jgi:hypothetical protein
MNQLEPCPACHRHVSTTEIDCPFCATPLPESLRKLERTPLRGRLSRAAILAVGATATLTSSCLFLGTSSAYGTSAGYDASTDDGTSDAGGAGGANDEDGGAGGRGGSAR